MKEELLIAPERPPGYFVGRETEFKALAERLTSGESVAVTALQGMGGIGKTALAQKLAHELREEFPGGMLWAKLGQRPDVYGILDRWAEAVGRDVTSVTDVTARAEIVRTLLARRDTVLAVLDDVWEYECANLLIRQALPANAVVLLTTRNAHLAKRLGCRVERIDVLPEGDALALISEMLGSLEEYEAAGREVARLVGYLPLALRIVAGMADRPADLVDIARKLRAKPVLDVLTLEPGERREENVEASLALSCDRLDAQMQWRFRALGVFAPAPFGADAVADVWGEGGGEDAAERVCDALHFLARRGLLTRGEGEMYTQHDLLRVYALALLERNGEAVAARGQHASYYRGLAKSGDWRVTELAFEQVRQGWASVKGRGTDVYGYFEDARRFLERRRWAEYLEWGHGALDWARREGDRETESRLLGDMGYTHWKRAEYAEALKSLEDGLTICQEISDRLQEAICLNCIGLVYRNRNQWAEALNYFERSLMIHQKLGTKAGEGSVLLNIGMVLFYHQSQWDEALRCLSRSLILFDEIIRIPVGDVVQEVKDIAEEERALALNTMGRVYYAMQQYDEAMDLWQRSLDLARDIGDRAGESRTMLNFGLLCLTRGEPDKASIYFRDSLDISKELGHRRAAARAYNGIGEASCLRGQYREALAYCQKALELHRGIGDHRQEANVLVSIGRIHLAQGACEQALNCFQLSLDIARKIGITHEEGIALHHIARAYEKAGCVPEAESAREQSAAIFRQLGISDQESVWF